MLLSIVLLFFNLFSCTKPENDCPDGNTDIWHKCVNQTLTNKGNISLDLNDDGKADYVFNIVKEFANGKTITNYCYATLVNPLQGGAGGLRFDYIASRVDTIIDSAYRPKVFQSGVLIDSSNSKWLLKQTMNEPNLVLYYGLDLVYNGQNLNIKNGIINQGQVYIAFRYYERDVEPKGWKNGWMKLEATMEKFSVLEVGYHKIPETKIKIGEI